MNNARNATGHMAGDISVIISDQRCEYCI